MTVESRDLRTRAIEVVAAADARFPLRAALLAGSAGRGKADRFSDLDVLAYADTVPSRDTLEAIRAAVDGGEPTSWPTPGDDFSAVEFRLDGIRTELSFFTVRSIEALLDRLLDRLEDVVSPLQKVLLGIDEAEPLLGEDLIGAWQGRLRPFPEPLRRAMVQRHWHFFALWHFAPAMAARDCTLWRYDVLLDGAFNLLGVLAGLNRLYFARFELKRMRALVARMPIAPPDLANRLEALFTAPPPDAATAFGALVEETRLLVERELPELAPILPRPLDSRAQPWVMGPSSAP